MIRNHDFSKTAENPDPRKGNFLFITFPKGEKPPPGWAFPAQHLPGYSAALFPVSILVRLN